MAKPTRYQPETIDSYIKAGYWESLSWSALWDRNAETFPDLEAIADSRTRLTWAKARQCIDRLALGLLNLGFRKDDVLVLQLPNCVELCLLRVACEKAGVLCLPVLRALRHKEISHIVKNTTPVGIVIPWTYSGFDYWNMINEIPMGPNFKHVLVYGDKVPDGTISIAELMASNGDEDQSAERFEKTRFRPDEVSWITLTTGTTGLPKFVESLLCAFTSAGKAIAERFRMTTNDVVAVLPSAAAGPNNVAYWGAPHVAAKIVMQEKYQTEEALGLIEKEKVTVACVVPAQLAMILRHPKREQYDLSSVRIWRSGGAPLPLNLAVEAEKQLPGVVINGFGSVDSGIQFLNSPEASHKKRLFTVGQPLPGHKVKIMGEDGLEVNHGEVGEIWLGGSTISTGYYKDLETTWKFWTKDGWFKTGDLGRLDEQGDLVIAGRKKDMIIRGGQNIYPLEIENILLEHPKVDGVCIVSMPDEIMGERACAFIKTHKEQTITFDEMVSFLKLKNISAYKLPERLEIIEELPVVGDQKLDRKRLRELIAKKLQAESKLTGA